MRTVEIKVYRFSELSEDVQEKVIDRYLSNGYPYDEWWDSVYEWAKERGKELGFCVDNIYFRGFWSQGDGAMFEGSVTDISKFLHGTSPHMEKALNNLCIYVDIKHRGHYYHSHCSDITVDHDCHWNYANIIDQIEIIEDNIREAYHDFCSEIYRALELEYDYLTSHEAMADFFESNGYEFDAQGRTI